MVSNFSPVEKLKHVAEAAALYPVYYLLRLLPIGVASFIFGSLTRLFGRFISRPHDIAIKNLKFCFPEKSDEEINKIAINAWDNIGRIAGEFPHIASYSNSRIREICPVSGLENLDEAIEIANRNDTGLLMVSAHIGNWELGARMLQVLDSETALLYRKANNPYVDHLIQKLRGKYTDFIIPKGDMTGMKDIIKHLKKGGRLGILSDQKVRDGVEVEFFGRKVLAPATAGEFCVKFGMPVVLYRTVRDEKEKTSFVFKMEKPVSAEGRSPQEIMQIIYSSYERWIREYPHQWFWHHNRFELGRKR
jgi:Kdo2-lipid IVA lauroyltransferase/acyltransferase